MKNSFATVIILLVLTLQITGCKKEELTKKNNAVSEKAKTAEVVSDTVFDRKNSYYPFMKKNHPEVINEHAMFFREKDIDLDGQNEAIIAFGNGSDNNPSIDNIFILKNDHGTITEIEADFGFEKYPFSNIQLVSLKGKDKYYISLEIAQWFNAKGFALYEMTGNDIKQIFTSASLIKEDDGFTGEFNDSLIDSNKDGQVDGYIQSTQYYLFSMKNKFAFENGTFNLKQKYFVMDEYPDTVFYVITQYICFRSFSFRDKMSNQRLEELCLDKTANPGPLKLETWELIFKSLNNNSVEMTDDYYDNDDVIDTKAIVEFSDSEKNINCQLKFELHRSGEKWQITKVDVVNN